MKLRPPHIRQCPMIVRYVHRNVSSIISAHMPLENDKVRILLAPILMRTCGIILTTVDQDLIDESSLLVRELLCRAPPTNNQLDDSLEQVAAKLLGVTGLPKVSLARSAITAHLARNSLIVEPSGSIQRVKDLRYTQSSCSCFFRDGHTVQHTIADLIDGRADPLRDEWLVLDVVTMHGELYSIDNRRLYCLKELQRLAGNSCSVLARIRYHCWWTAPRDSVLDTFWQHYTTECDGRNIVIRRCWNARVCASRYAVGKHVTALHRTRWRSHHRPKHLE